ncbi:diaminopimelate decarboxylase [Pendulispora rubella]|uniref:Diaminopimelate decarboxylase n=1 Tax=Pendulispora rubella TaxID=2741070 RepID=A0ABZ2LIN0_9BACT
MLPHAIAPYLQEYRGVLHVADHSVMDLRERFGSNVFVFSESQITDNVRSLQRAYQRHYPRFRIMYASKACSNLEVLRHIVSLECGLDANSGGELFKARLIGASPERIVYNGTSKSVDEVTQGVIAGIRAFNVDSISELKRIGDIAHRLGLTANVMPRVIPGVLGGTVAGFETGHVGSKFGMPFEDLPEVVRVLRDYPCLKFRGFHCHVGSQVVRAEAFASAMRTVVAEMVRFGRETGFMADTMNMGGGFPIPLVPEGTMPVHRDGSPLPEDVQALMRGTLSIPDVAAETAAAWNAAGADPADFDVFIEPGRSVIGTAGILLSTIEARKTRPDGVDWLLTDCGFNTMPETLWYDWYYHIVSGNRASEPADTAFRVGGPLCDTGDSQHDETGRGRLPNVRWLPKNTGIGDCLVVVGTGAYCIEQQSNYNGRPRAAAVMVRTNGVVEWIARRETYEDLVARDFGSGVAR